MAGLKDTGLVQERRIQSTLVTKISYVCETILITPVGHRPTISESYIRNELCTNNFQLQDLMLYQRQITYNHYTNFI